MSSTTNNNQPTGNNHELEFSYHNHRKWYKIKLTLIYCLLLNDLIINSAADHDDFETIVPDNTLDYFLFVAQVIGEILIFLMFFLMLLPTYLFRVGLLGVLASHFKPVLYLYPTYFLLTLMVAGYRLVWLLDLGCERPQCLVGMWGLVGFTEVNIIHKIVSGFYYVANIRATIHLAHPRFYRKQHWVELYYNKYIAKSSGQPSSSAAAAAAADLESFGGHRFGGQNDGTELHMPPQLAAVFRNTFNV